MTDHPVYDQNWKHTAACDGCEAGLACVAGELPRGTRVNRVARTDGRVLDKYGVYLKYTSDPGDDAFNGIFNNIPLIILSNCPRLSRMFYAVHKDGDEPALEVLL